MVNEWLDIATDRTLLFSPLLSHCNKIDRVTAVISASGVNDRFTNHAPAMIIIEAIREDATRKAARARRGESASKGLDPWLEPTPSFGTDKGREGGAGKGNGTRRNLVPKTRV